MTARELEEQLQLIMQGRAPDGFSWWEVVGALLKENDRLRQHLLPGGYGDGGDS